MKKLFKITLLSLFLTLHLSNSYAKVIGTMVNGIPVVSISWSDMQNQIDNLNNCGFTNVTLEDMYITYTASSGGFFFYKFTYNEPGTSLLQGASVMDELNYDDGTNEFEIENGGRRTVCVKSNCDGCDVNGHMSCSTCAPIIEGDQASCEAHQASVKGCVDVLLYSLLSWLL